MKTVVFMKYVAVLLLGVLYGCAPASIPTSSTESPKPTNTPRAVEPPTVQPSVTATTNPKYQEIVEEILRLTDEYNAQVERFRQMEGVEIIIDPQAGKETMDLSQQTIEQLTPLNTRRKNS
ncbi:MAG: hypothetical protein DDG60_10035 [Anaerolineae bacterium]|nr:MAG: hypothetical protein DDG60_10035 [Anaerolineae bacterium]